MAFTLTIIGIPTAKGRPRLTTRGGFARAFTPTKTREAESDARGQVERQWNQEPLTGPIGVVMEFHMPKPKSLKKGTVHHSKKPDLDNLIKLCGDSLNGLVWSDDSIICSLEAFKRYSDTPKTVLHLTLL